LYFPTLVFCNNFFGFFFSLQNNLFFSFCNFLFRMFFYNVKHVFSLTIRKVFYLQKLHKIFFFKYFFSIYFSLPLFSNKFFYLMKGFKDHGQKLNTFNFFFRNTVSRFVWHFFKRISFNKFNKYFLFFHSSFLGLSFFDYLNRSLNSRLYFYRFLFGKFVYL
jgi:hypothetical protein